MPRRPALAGFLRPALAGVLGLVASAANAQTPYALGARIGPTLEPAEQVYFGLFPRLTSAGPLRFEAVGESVRVVDPRGLLLEIPRARADSLARLTETFEDAPTVIANPWWNASAGFLHLIDPQTPVPAVPRARRVDATTPGGMYRGYVLYSTDSLLVLSPTLRPREADLPGAYVLRRSELRSLYPVRSRQWQGWGPVLGAALGAGAGTAFEPVGGTALLALIGHTVGQIASRLSGPGAAAPADTSWSGLALFNGPRPPELPSPDDAIRRVRERARPPAGPLPRRPRRHEWVSVGGQSILSQHEPQAPLVRDRVLTSESPATFATTDLPVVRDTVSLPFRIDVAVRPLPWVRLGVSYGPYSVSQSTGVGRSTERIDRGYGSFRPYGEAILPALRLGRQRVEASVGVARVSYDVRASQRPPFNVFVDGRPVRAVQDSLVATSAGTAWAPFAGLELYTSPHTSLFVRHTWARLPKLDVPEYRSIGQFETDLTVRFVAAHRVDASLRELTIGARAHF